MGMGGDVPYAGLSQTGARNQELLLGLPMCMQVSNWAILLLSQTVSRTGSEMRRLDWNGCAYGKPALQLVKQLSHSSDPTAWAFNFSLTSLPFAEAFCASSTLFLELLYNRTSYAELPCPCKWSRGSVGFLCLFCIVYKGEE